VCTKQKQRVLLDVLVRAKMVRAVSLKNLMLFALECGHLARALRGVVGLV